MATIPSVNNQLPQLQHESSNAPKADSDAIVPFGHWLQKESQSQELPKPIQFKQSDSKAEGQVKENGETTEKKALFADKTPAKEKPAKALFKETAPQKAGKGAKHAEVNAGSAKTTKNTDAASKLQTKTQIAATVDKVVANTDQTATKSAKTQVAWVAKNTTVTNKAAVQAPSFQKGAQSTSKAFKPIISVHSTARPNLSASQPDFSQPQTPESLAKLKTNVKAIFNSLTPLKTSVPTDTSGAKKGVPSVEINRPIVMDRVKPIRLTSQPATTPKVLADGKTTLQHLQARKSTHLDAETRYQLTAEKQDVRVVTEQASKAVLTAKTKSPSDKSASIQLVIENPADAKKASAKSKKHGKKNVRLDAAKKAQQSFSYDHVQHVAKEAESVKANPALQGANTVAGQAELVQTEANLSDANSNNLMGKGEANNQISFEKGKGKVAQAHASRSLSWLKALSDRTSQINRQDPNWKVLEMKLDKGDGRMIVKVMREDEHVSVSVQFSDDTLRANAESQMPQIIESLKEQYGKEVTFTFGEQADSELNASLEQKAARKRRAAAKSAEAEQAVRVQQYHSHSPDQRMWIG